ncbi:hypothetical protein HDV00_003706 [Rhizophlyctis rosea]|nr:hypothetical protein HDV00_003706 [Rhizophlyctis rosea]
MGGRKSVAKEVQSRPCFPTERQYALHAKREKESFRSLPDDHDHGSEDDSSSIADWSDLDLDTTSKSERNCPSVHAMSVCQWTLTRIRKTATQATQIAVTPIGNPQNPSTNYNSANLPPKSPNQTVRKSSSNRACLKREADPAALQPSQHPKRNRSNTVAPSPPQPPQPPTAPVVQPPISDVNSQPGTSSGGPSQDPRKLPFVPFPPPICRWGKIHEQKKSNAHRIRNAIVRPFPAYSLFQARRNPNHEVWTLTAVVFYFLPHGLSPQHHEDLYAHFKHFETYYPPPNNGSKDARHRIKLTEKQRQALQNLALVYGNWHIGGNRIRIPQSGLWVNLNKDVQNLDIVQKQVLEGLLSGVPFRGMTEVMGAGMEAIDSKMFEMCKDAFANMPGFLKKFWRQFEDGLEKGMRPGNDWAHFFVLIDDLLCNMHKDGFDSPDCLCGMAAVGEFKARVCLHELGVSIPWAPRDLLWIRSSHIGHHVNKVEGKKRFNAVYAVHDVIFKKERRTHGGKW